MNFCVIQNSMKTTYLFRKTYLEVIVKLHNGNVSVIAPNDCPRSSEMLRGLGVNVIPVPYLNFSLGRFFSCILMNLYLIGYRMRFRHAVYICHFLSTFVFIYPTLIFFNKRINLYVEGLGSIFSKDNVLKKIISKLISHRHVTRYFCNEDEKCAIGLMDDFVTHGIGIDLSSFSCKKTCGNKSIDRAFELLYVGRLIDDKGVFDAIELLDVLLSRNVLVKLTLVGDIYPSNPSSLNKSDVISLSEKYGEHIEFIPFTDDIAKIYQSKDMLILPSRREGFPVCVMEASACGVPSLCYNVPGCNSAIAQGINGFLVEYKQINEMSHVVEECINNWPEFIKMTQLSHSYAVNNFCAKQKANVFLSKVLGN